jgi:hypothetical protein
VSELEGNLQDVEDVLAALIEARHALTRVIAGLGAPGDRETFIFKVGFARGRLSRVSERIYAGGELGEADATKQ